MNRATTWVVGCIAAAALCSSCDRPERAPGDIRGDQTYPSWAKPAETGYTEGKPWLLAGTSRSGDLDALHQHIARVRYVTTALPESPDRPFLLLRCSQLLSLLDQDRLALQLTEQVLSLPESTPHNATLYGYPSLYSIAEDARLVRARLLARNGLTAWARDALDSCSRTDGIAALTRGFVLALDGDTAGAVAALATAHGPGHPERGFSDIYLRMRAATITRTLGQDGLATTISEPILSQGINAQKWPQWKSAWSILSTLRENIARGPAALPSDRPDGWYEGACRGFVDTVRVAVHITRGRIDSLSVVKAREDRPWTALHIMPERIVRANSLLVDAVSGASVTSCAVVAAVDQALASASPVP